MIYRIQVGAALLTATYTDEATATDALADTWHSHPRAFLIGFADGEPQVPMGAACMEPSGPRCPATGRHLCVDCGAVLTDEERHYYRDRCEGCEQADLARYQAWRHGGDDPELDALYSRPPDTVH